MSIIRAAALKGGGYLAGRQVLSIGLKVMGVFLITRALGPGGYGAYVSAFNVYQYSLALGSAGVGVYLLHVSGELSEKSFGSAYLILAVMATVLGLLIWCCLDVLHEWINVPGFDSILLLMLWALPMQLLAIPATVRMERDLEYRLVAKTEILGQLIYYFVAATAICVKAGPKSLAIGLIAQQAFTIFSSHIWTKTVPTFHFDRREVRKIIRYSASFSSANWVWQARSLVNPMLVGPALGASAVGVVGLTISIVEVLSVLKTIAWRLSISVLRHIRTDSLRLRGAVTQGMELQTLGLGTVLLAFGWVGDILVPLTFGERWRSVMLLYPYIATAYLTAAPFNMHSATLSVLNQNGRLTTAFGVNLFILGVATFVFVQHMGVTGYGLAELAALPSFVLVHMCLSRQIGSPDYRLTALWWGGAVAGLFWKQAGLWSIATPFAVLALPVSIRHLRKYARMFSLQRSENPA